ncbi:F0F1 ATP synthase subunit delta [Ornithinimicrobium sp. F0845]|uniref:F0F1 ATP synthase subunit delta n=1 Tax=Ornithinimicrobium sp. F0845 TaxID=2926412 RepID=UPI001FF1E10C|nr:F0F1 ATP synthase subunit delta [Ornithinimicrobium sp. F0845]MCK0112332.1 F0F1 ATP synthase subunit delta [Ornithinimicrobium sp. F0845]
MQGASRSALAESREVLSQALEQGADRSQLGEELLKVAGVIGGNAVLRRSLADPSRESQPKIDLVNRLFSGRVSDEALHVASTVASRRWAAEGDLTATLESFGVEAILAQAEAAGRLSQVEDELFRFGRIVDGTGELRSALTDRRAPAAAKGKVVKTLLGDRSAPETVRLAELAATHRSTRFDHAIEAYLAIAARRQEQLTAMVTTAVPLTEQQLDRLTSALGSHYGREIRANAVVDPQVVGGIRVDIGDEVIDGTILSRLDEARRRMTS